MERKLEKACVYHYLFSSLPEYRRDETVSTMAQETSVPLIEKFQLNSEESFTVPHPDVMPLIYKVNEKSQTYLFQFWSNDTLSTVLTLNQNKENQSPLDFFQDSLDIDFGDSRYGEQFGRIPVLFAQTKENLSQVQEIATRCFDLEIRNPVPTCQFEWGALYFLTEIQLYVLLSPNEKAAAKGDIFLAFDFPMLEAIRQKVFYEEIEAKKLNVENSMIESKLRQHLHLIFENLNAQEDEIESVEELLDKMDDTEAKIYENISNTDGILHTLAIIIRNYKEYLKTVPIGKDTLFTPLVRQFNFVSENIEAELKYTKLQLGGIERKQDTIPLKIDLLKQRTQEQNNKIEKRQNMLIAVLGVIIGTGEVLPGNLPWETKLMWMGVSGAVAMVLVNILNLGFFKKGKRKKA